MAHYKTEGRLAVAGRVASPLGLGLEPTVYSAPCGRYLDLLTLRKAIVDSLGPNRFG